MDIRIQEGTSEELALYLVQHPNRRFRLIDLSEELFETKQPSPEEIVAEKLRQWQEQDGKVLMPDVPIRTLFAQWAEEDARMTDAEREAEDRLWQDIEKGLNQTRTELGMRSL